MIKVYITTRTPSPEKIRSILLNKIANRHTFIRVYMPSFSHDNGSGSPIDSQVLTQMLSYGGAHYPSRPLFEDMASAIGLDCVTVLNSNLHCVEVRLTKKRKMSYASRYTIDWEKARAEIEAYVQNWLAEFNYGDNADSTIRKKGFNHPYLHYGDLLLAIKVEIVQGGEL